MEVEVGVTGVRLEVGEGGGWNEGGVGSWCEGGGGGGVAVEVEVRVEVG